LRYLIENLADPFEFCPDCRHFRDLHISRWGCAICGCARYLKEDNEKSRHCSMKKLGA